MRPVVDIDSKVFVITNNLLGAGAFSLVKKAYLKERKEEVALKICHCNHEGEWLQSLKEICILRKITHPNIVRIMGHEITRFHVLIGLEKGDNTLKVFMDNRSILELRNFSLSIMRQLITALNFLYTLKIIHSDIKPSNILYKIINENDVSIQIMDFGLSHITLGALQTQLTEAGGTMAYQAPERLFKEGYDESSDLFSAGIIFTELLFKKHPFFKEGKNYVEYMRRRPEPNFPKESLGKVPRDWMKLVYILLSFSPKTREEVRNHIVLGTTMPERNHDDHQELSYEVLGKAMDHERNARYADAAIAHMDACIYLSIACYEIQDQDRIKTLNTRITGHKKKVVTDLHLFRHTFAPKASGSKSNTVHDEFYEYLMDVCSSTPQLKHYLEMGYNAELYLIEEKKDLAFKMLMGTLQYLNSTMPFEPEGDRKAVIGIKMLQWTTIAETLKKELKK